MGVKDKFANLVNAIVITNGSSVVKNEVNTGVSLADGRGMLIDQIDYYYDTTVMADYVAGATSDYMKAAWFTQSPLAAADFLYNNSRCLHVYEKQRLDLGVAAAGVFEHNPRVFQFFPPLIVAAPKFFFGCFGSSAIAGGTIYSRMYFRYVKLKPSEYLELAEAFILIG